MSQTRRGSRVGPSYQNSFQPNPKSGTYRVLLKFTTTRKPTRDDIFKTSFQDLNAPLIRLTETSNGYYAVTDTEDTIDKLISNKAIQSFAKINLSPTIPPDLRAKRTVFVRQVETTAGGQAADNIKLDLEKNHPWLKINAIIKIKDYTHVFKIICNETQMATKILETGLLLFNTRITPRQCEREQYTHLLICFKCYKMEDHPTKDCPSNKTICSECAQEGHTFRECTSNYKKCTNCRNDHRTLAASCPYRKQKIKEKELQTTHQTNKDQFATYSEIAKAAIRETTPNVIHLTSKTHLKMTALILEAHIASLSGQQNYGQILSDSLKRNFDIDTVFPDRDSTKIFHMYFNSDGQKQTDVDSNSDSLSGESDKEDEEPKTSSRKRKKSKSQSPTEQPPNRQRKTSTTKNTQSQPTLQKDYQLVMFRSEKKKSPTKITTTHQLCQELQNNRIKIGTKYHSPDNVLKLLKDGLITIQDDRVIPVNHNYYQQAPSISNMNVHAPHH